MDEKGWLNKILVLLGTVLVWIPILATLLLSAASSIRDRVFRFDYLIPEELFLAALAGGLLLLVVAFRAHRRRGFIGWGLGIMAVMLVGGQALAVASGLASGARPAVGLPWVLLLGSLVIYCLALVVVAVTGILLISDLFRHPVNAVETVESTN